MARAMSCLAFALAACVGPDSSWWQAKVDAIAAATLVIDFEVAPEFAQGVSGDQLKRLEAETLTRLEERCATPIYAELDAGYEAAAPQLGALNRLLPIAAKVDREMQRCFARERAMGNLYVEVEGRLLSNEEFVRMMVNLLVTRPTNATSVIGHWYRGGCGSRGGPGYRKSNGKCASWSD